MFGYSLTATPALVTVSVRPTPNPDALMFRLDGGVAIESGLLAFHSPAEATESPLGAALFGLPGVLSILIVPAFVTVTKRPEADWTPLADEIEHLVRAHVGA